MTDYNMTDHGYESFANAVADSIPSEPFQDISQCSLRYQINDLYSLIDEINKCKDNAIRYNDLIHFDIGRVNDVLKRTYNLISSMTSLVEVLNGNQRPQSMSDLELSELLKMRKVLYNRMLSQLKEDVKSVKSDLNYLIDREAMGNTPVAKIESIE